MFGRLGVMLLTPLLAVAAGCAQPKYELVNANGLNAESGQRESQEQGARDCPLRFRSSGYCLAWKWETLPTSRQPGALIFKIYRGNLYDDSPVETDLEVMPSLILWMPSMGHGSSPTTVIRIDVGTYRASNVFFIMPGEWELRFQAKEGSSVQDEAVLALTI